MAHGNWPSTTLAKVAKGQALDYSERGRIREWLLEEPRQRRWMEALDARLDAHERDAVRLYAELLGMVGSERDLVLVFVQSLGFSDPTQLSGIVRTMSEAEGLDEDALAARSERFLREYHARHGRKLVILDEAKEVNGGPAGDAS